MRRDQGQSDSAKAEASSKDNTNPLAQMQRLHSREKRSWASRIWQLCKYSFLLAICAVALGGFYTWYTQRVAVAETEIFQGITYTCQPMPVTEESSGLAYIVRIQLDEPGVELFTTPVEPDLRDNPHWQYRLATTSQVLQTEKLAVVINGTQFGSDSLEVKWNEKSYPIRLSGDLATSNEMIVSDGVFNKIEPTQYLLWFEQDGTPQLEKSRGVPEEVQANAQWGIGALSLLATDGKLGDRPGPPDKQTLIGIDTQKKLLWLACFDHSTREVAATKLLEQGAKDIIRVDGGDSSSMAIGERAANIAPGGITGGWQPSATHFGVRARTLD